MNYLFYGTQFPLSLSAATLRSTRVCEKVQSCDIGW